MTNSPLNDLDTGSGLTYIFAVLALLASATLWGTIWYPLRLLQEQGLEGLWCALLMYGTALVVSIPWWARHRAAFFRRPLVLAWLGLASGWANIAFILAVIDGEVVRVTLLFFLYPIWATLIGRFVLREQMSVRAWLGFAIAVAGALIMMWNPDLDNPLPRDNNDWLALSAGVAFAVSAAIVRSLDEVDVVPKTIVVWAGVVVVAAIWLLIDAAEFPALEGKIYMAAVLLGLFATVAMTLLVQYGFHHVPVSRSSVILLFELVAGALSAYWLANEIPVTNEWLGGVVIVLGAWLVLTVSDIDGGDKKTV
ncbi:MAG: DMT family transporter [Gammaproteobacteria bacterium]|nr:DMT family transporter [Gammaproteobacteria bacterium]